MSDVQLAQFQEAAVRRIVAQLRNRSGSRRMLLADEVGLGKTLVAQGVIQSLLKGRRRPLTVVYLCSNAEIAEQNRTKLDPNSRKPIGRVTELAVKLPSCSADLLLYSFTPGTSLKDGTGLAWERRLMLYLFQRLYGAPVDTMPWRDFFRCGAGEDNWRWDTTPTALSREFERKTSVDFQKALAIEWRATQRDQAVKNMVPIFDSASGLDRSSRNHLVGVLRGAMQRVALRHLKPDLVILDEVQRFRDVLDEANNREHIAAALFSRRVPVLVLSATPYRALTLGHELAEGVAPHHEDFFKTLDFLFDLDKETPARVRRNLNEFGERLSKSESAEQLDHEVLRLKDLLEGDLTKVMCRTERNWYVHARGDRDDDGVVASGTMPGKAELKEFFLLHKALSHLVGMGQVTEFWKSAPSLLTFLDGQYHPFRALRDGKAKVSRELLTAPVEVKSLANRNHRIAKVAELAFGGREAAPPLWIRPTYPYYRDDYFGEVGPRKVLVFSGWRFVPKTVAIVASRVASDRIGGEPDDTSQPVRFTEKWSFHVFDLCFPSPALARIGDEAFKAVRNGKQAHANDVLKASYQTLRRRLLEAGVAIVQTGGQRSWQSVMRLERHEGRSKEILDALNECVDEQEGAAAKHLRRHTKAVEAWLRQDCGVLQLSVSRLRRLALVAAFSPALSVLRACQSAYGEGDTASAFPGVAKLCLGPMRRYFNRPLVQQVIRQHRFRMRWRQMPSRDKGYAERALVYAGDAHLQAVLDEYMYLLRQAAQADTVDKALTQVSEVWKLSRGSPRTNKAKGSTSEVRIEENAEVHATHFALAFGEDILRDTGPDGADTKLRKSVVREAFNSPFWPFVLATTSVGQEGLDFHLYCRDVLHWNLPSNPVDLEQREGRINRRDCLAVRASIARDWPLDLGTQSGPEDGASRNPWLSVFDKIERSDDVQKYKHGLFPHWVYECKDSARTVRIQRHAPFFSTSRDALKYQRLKAGLALYRLAFGQVNQEDLLETLQRQAEGLGPENRSAMLRRLRSYMLNLSPIRYEDARRYTAKETDGLLRGGSDYTGLRQLLRAVREVQTARAHELKEVKPEIDGLVSAVEHAVSAGDVLPATIRRAVEALVYLRNPFDHIFDVQVEGGFADDIAMIRKAWGTLKMKVS